MWKALGLNLRCLRAIEINFWVLSVKFHDTKGGLAVYEMKETLLKQCPPPPAKKCIFEKYFFRWKDKSRVSITTHACNKPLRKLVDGANIFDTLWVLMQEFLQLLIYISKLIDSKYLVLIVIEVNSRILRGFTLK